MTGNDIVDIASAAAESNWKRKGFLEKLFTKQEQNYIHAAVVPAEMVWKLWSMKESAYKIYIRQYGGRFFAPLKFNCTILNKSKGTVNINNATYLTTTTLTKKYIYSIAKLIEANDTLIANHCLYINEKDCSNHQQFIYKKIIKYFAAITGISKKGLIVIKDQTDMPFLFCESNKLKMPVSITHHGNYAAFTINYCRATVELERPVE